MKITLKNNIVEMSGDELRQYIDAKSVFTALESARKTAKKVGGGMIWREHNGTDYLIRTSTRSAQTSLGPRSEKTEGIYTNFIARKERSQERVRDLRAEITRHQRMNNALRVGRAPDLLIEILNKIEEFGLSEYFTQYSLWQSIAGLTFYDSWPRYLIRCSRPTNRFVAELPRLIPLASVSGVLTRIKRSVGRVAAV